LDPRSVIHRAEERVAGICGSPVFPAGFRALSSMKKRA
jgi:hypothetical protein